MYAYMCSKVSKASLYSVIRNQSYLGLCVITFISKDITAETLIVFSNILKRGPQLSFCQQELVSLYARNIIIDINALFLRKIFNAVTNFS
jgi:hypothetical protein